MANNVNEICNSNFPQRLEHHLSSDVIDFCCPISAQRYTHPVRTPCHHLFEKIWIIQELEIRQRCPMCRTFYLKRYPNHVSNPNAPFIQPMKIVIEAANKRIGKLYVDNCLNSIAWQELPPIEKIRHPFCNTSLRVLSFLEKKIMCKVRRGEMPLSQGMVDRKGGPKSFLAARRLAEEEQGNWCTIV